MSSLPLRVVALASALLSACGQKPPSPGPESTTTGGSATGSTAAPTEVAAPGERLYVDAQLVECEGGAGPMTCMRTRGSESEEWSLFYDSIEGFTHEAGHSYELRVEKITQPNPPADAASFRYKLIEIVSKKP